VDNKFKTTIDWLKSERIKNRLIFSVMYILLIFIPACYTFFNKIPPLEDLQVTTGVFSYKNTGAKLGKIIILNGDAANYYTCRRTLINKHECYHFDAKLHSMVGKTTQIWWYEQNLYFWYSQRSLVRLVVDGREEYNYKMAVSDNERAKNYDFYSSIVLLAICVALCVLLERIDKHQTQTKEEPNHE